LKTDASARNREHRWQEQEQVAGPYGGKTHFSISHFSIIIFIEITLALVLDYQSLGKH
jgi:hypothetical protein